MKTLFVDRKNAVLDIDRNRLVIKVDTQRSPASIPFSQIETLVIGSQVQMNSLVITRLSEAGITVIFLHPRNTDACTLTVGSLHNNARRRLAQYRLTTDAHRCGQAANRIVTAKVRSQQALLKRLLKQRPDLRHDLTTAISRLDSVLTHLQTPVSTETLLGLEGSLWPVFRGRALYRK